MSESNTNQPSKLERNKNSASSDSEEDSDKPKVKTSSSSTTSTDEESSSNKREGRSTFSITSSEGRAKEKPHRLHAREKITLSKHSVPVIHEIQSGHLKPAASPRTSMMVKDMHGAFGAGHNPDPTRLFISPRLHPGERGKPTMTSPESAMSPRKILNLKNHIVEIPMKQPLKLVEQEAVNQFLSPRFENSPRVFEARMIELQAQYERQNASLTKTNQKKSEEINNLSLKINDLTTENECLKSQIQELQKENEQLKQSSENTNKEDIDALTQNLTNLALENMELRTKMGKIQGGSVVCENSLELLERLSKEENIAVLKNTVFELNQKQLSYDRSVELYEQEIRKVIHSARHSIVKEKEKRKQMEQEIIALHGKIRELEFFIIEELADLANFSEGDQGDSVGSVSDPYNYEDGEEYDDDDAEEDDDEEDEEELQLKRKSNPRSLAVPKDNISNLSSS